MRKGEKERGMYADLHVGTEKGKRIRWGTPPLFNQLALDLLFFASRKPSSSCLKQVLNESSRYILDLPLRLQSYHPSQVNLLNDHQVSVLLLASVVLSEVHILHSLSLHETLSQLIPHPAFRTTAQHKIWFLSLRQALLSSRVPPVFLL